MKVMKFSRGTTSRYLRVTLDTPIGKGRSAIAIDHLQPETSPVFEMMTDEGKKLIEKLSLLGSMDTFYLIDEQTISAELNWTEIAWTTMQNISDLAKSIGAPAPGATT